MKTHADADRDPLPKVGMWLPPVIPDRCHRDFRMRQQRDTDAHANGSGAVDANSPANCQIDGPAHGRCANRFYSHADRYVLGQTNRYAGDQANHCADSSANKCFR